MMILILLLLMIAVVMVLRRQQKAQAEARYWEHVNQLESQRKQQILVTAIKMQQQKTSNSAVEENWKQAS